MTDPIARMIAEKMYGEQIAEALLSRFNVTQKGTVT